MEKSDDPNYLNRLAKKLLHHLDVDVPNTKKIDYATIILSIIGTLSEELNFEEVLSTQEFECLYWTINGCDQNQIAKLRLSRKHQKRNDKKRPQQAGFELM